MLSYGQKGGSDGCTPDRSGGRVRVRGGFEHGRLVPATGDLSSKFLQVASSLPGRGPGRPGRTFPPAGPVTAADVSGSRGRRGRVPQKARRSRASTAGRPLSIGTWAAMARSGPPQRPRSGGSLSSRGFVTPQPSKRPKASLRRFEADWPNEPWQADHTTWKLANGVRSRSSTSSTATAGCAWPP